MKKMGSWSTILAFLVLSGCFPYHVMETPELSGRVMDSRSGQPVVAHLYYEDFPDQIVTSSVDGVFRFPAIRRWETVVVGTDHMPARVLVIEATGYRSATKAIYLGGSDTLVVSLDPTQ